MNLCCCSVTGVWFFATPWTVALQASLSITNSRSLLKLVSIESVMPFNHLILCCPLHSFNLLSSCLQSFPASGSFLMSQLFTSSGQRTGASASASLLKVNRSWCMILLMHCWSWFASILLRIFTSVFVNDAGL